MTNQELLDEALAARHKLLTGQARVVVGFGETRIEYSAAKLADLERYIAKLQMAIAGTKPTRSRITYMVPD